MKHQGIIYYVIVSKSRIYRAFFEEVSNEGNEAIIAPRLRRLLFFIPP